MSTAALVTYNIIEPTDYDWAYKPAGFLQAIQDLVESYRTMPVAGPMQLIYDPISFKRFWQSQYGGPVCKCDWCCVEFEDPVRVEHWEEDYASMKRTIPMPGVEWIS